VGFRLVQVLLWSNRPTFIIVVLCCEKTMSFFRCVVGCYFYSQENRFIDMISF
jgi:hypothetical protein